MVEQSYFKPKYDSLDTITFFFKFEKVKIGWQKRLKILKTKVSQSCTSTQLNIFMCILTGLLGIIHHV